MSKEIKDSCKVKISEVKETNLIKVDCGYGIDFCPSPASAQSIIQGVLGRTTGYDKFTTG